MRAGQVNRRKNYFIDRGFQSRFILKFCALIIAASALSAGFIYYFNQKSTTVAFDNLRVVVKSTANFILPIVLQILVVVTALVGIGTVLVTLFTTHKISGPLYRLKMSLEQIRRGDLTSPVSIRAQDQLQKVAEELDGLRLGLKGSLGRLKQDWAALKSELSELQASGRSQEERRRLQAHVERIDAELDKFETE